MQVQLKQSEIEAALKGYIAQQGINLTNKTVTCTFTAGRKDSGISVELEIEEQALMVPFKVLEASKTSEDTFVLAVPLGLTVNPSVGASFTTSVETEEIPKVTTSSLFA